MSGNKRGAATRQVVPRKEGNWGVVAPGAKRKSALAPTQRAAEAKAMAIVGNRGDGEVRIYGRIRDSETVPRGNDPSSSKDTKH